MAKALTAKSVEGAKPGATRREIPDGGFPGLYLVLQPSGAKSWAYRYRIANKPRKLTLGDRRAPFLSLADAREEARKAARGIELGEDPGAAKIESKVALAVIDPERDKFATQIETYFKRHLVRLRTGAEARRVLDRAAAHWAGRDVGTISKRDVVELLDNIVDGGSPIAANRTLAYLRAFFGWVKARDVIASCPTDGVKAPVAERSRDRILTDDEVAVLWQAAGALGQPFGPLYRFLLLTGQRLREAAEMTDGEVSGDLWNIGAARAKNAEAHVVPLSDAAREALADVKRIGRKYVFTTTGDAPVSGFAKGKARLDKAMAKLSAEPIPPFVIHDLRRTCASGMARLGIAPHVVEAVLNHRSGTVSGVARIYNRHNYEAEKRAALEAWAAHVMGLVKHGTAAGE